MTRSPARPRTWSPPARPSSGSSASPSSTSASPSRPSPWWPAPATRRTTSPLPWRWTRRPRPCGVNFIGGFSALVQKGFTTGDRAAASRSIPEALATTELRLLLRQRRLHQGGHQHGRRGADGPRSSRRRPTSPPTRTASAAPSWWSSANAVEDNPFMAGAFHGVGEAGMRHQRGRLRPRRGAPRPAEREGRAL